MLRNAVGTFCRLIYLVLYKWVGRLESWKAHEIKEELWMSGTNEYRNKWSGTFLINRFGTL